MGEIETIAKLLQTLGISSLLAPLLALIAMSFFIRKYILAGAGDFLQKLATKYLQQNTERIALETRIDIKLGALADSLEKFVAQLMDIERRDSERIKLMKDEISERIHNIEIVISDNVLNEISSLYKLFEEHTDEMAQCINNDHNCKIKMANMRTEEFRVSREQARQELIK